MTGYCIDLARFHSLCDACGLRDCALVRPDDRVADRVCLGVDRNRAHHLAAEGDNRDVGKRVLNRAVKVWARDDRPRGPVPVLDERRLTTRGEVVSANSPRVVHRFGGHSA